MVVYILYSPDFDRFYIGQSQDVLRRVERHNSGTEPATRPYIPWEMVMAIPKPSRSEAVILERKLKNLSRERLIAFIEKYRAG